jgi:outer membrane biosynthesis protein TonB
MHEGPYISPHFEATFYPEDVSFAALAKTIRASARTFELFDIAKTVIGKHDRFVVVLDRKSNKSAAAEEKKPFHVCLLDGMPFDTEEAAINHVVQNHISRFFKVTQEEGEPPKGSFQVINKCGVTGELLGPPNYHLYNQIVQQHHASKLPRMNFENFSHRIESVRDEEVVAQWLESMKTITRYTWLGDANVPAKPEGAQSDEASAESSAPEEPAAEAPVESAAEPETEPAEAPVEPAAQAEETAPEPAAEESSEAPAEEAPAVEEAPAAEAAPAAVEPVPVDQLTFDSISEAKVHLITKAREKCVRTYEHGRFHGRIIADMPDGEVKRAVLGALERQQRFPLDTANALRGRLRREGFTIFKKGSKGISYVSAVKRKFRVAGQTFADSINDLITFIEKHPMVKVSELTEKFLEITPLEAPKTEGETPTATAPGTVSSFGEADQPRIKRMQVDLRWLVTEGYVTEFIDGSLFAAPPMPPVKPKPEPKPKSEPKAEAPAATESAPEATPAAPAEAEATATPVAAEAEVQATSTETPAAAESVAESEPAPAVEETPAAPEPEAAPEAGDAVVAPESEAVPVPEVTAEPEPAAAPEVAPEPEAVPAAAEAEVSEPEPSAAPEPKTEEAPAAEVEAESSNEAAAPAPDEEKEKPQS